jgi:isoleucyl-tRNA synthetase
MPPTGRVVTSIGGDLDDHPWTLPANLAIALHPDFDYAAVETGDGEVLRAGPGTGGSCMTRFGITDYRILSRLTAKDLERNAAAIHFTTANR